MVEMIISMVVAGMVMGGVYQLLIVQSRSYGTQREVMDVQETLRSAVALLAWEIRQSWAGGGDLYSITATSITLRSTQGAGTICAKHATDAIYGLMGADLADVIASSEDSARVHVAAGNYWSVMRIDDVDVPGAMGIGFCQWTLGNTSQTPDLAVELRPDVPSDTAGIRIGAPFRAFRRVEYGLYKEDPGDGRWWLGRKVGAAASYEKLTGPFLPGAQGLKFTYRDAAGTSTTDPAQVEVIDFVLRAESYRPSGNRLGFQQDSVATRVALRH